LILVGALLVYLELAEGLCVFCTPMFFIGAPTFGFGFCRGVGAGVIPNPVALSVRFLHPDVRSLHPDSFYRGS
jgi:hypothetical protein